MFQQTGAPPRKGLCRCSDKCLDIDDGLPKCTRPKPNSASGLFVENVLDIANTLAKVMIICGIHECTAKNSVDTIVNAFLHCDQVCKNSDPLMKKRLRKAELYHDLGKKCLMNRVEAELAYMIIKRGFKAFYYNPLDELSLQHCAKPRVPDECLYVHAAKRTAQTFAHYDGLTCQEQLCVEYRIKKVYEDYYNRMEARMIMAAEQVRCKCCLCGKGMEFPAKPSKPAVKPCKKIMKKKKKPSNDKCTCCRLIKRKVKKPKRKPPKCLDPLNPCTCGKKPFILPWVKSIWERPDMRKYYIKTFGKLPKPIPEIEPCKDWPDPYWLQPMAGYHPTAEAACWDWFDADYLKRWESTNNDDDKPLGDPHGCKEWKDPIWLSPMTGRYKPSESDCNDWFDPPYLKHFAVKE